jgi:hypothetical protein
MRWLLGCFTLALVLLPLRAIASGGEVQGVVEIAAGIHQRGSIEIARNATLRVKVGGVIQFAAGASLKGSGRLEVLGSVTQPVYFTGRLANVAVTGDVVIRHLHIVEAEGPLLLGGEELYVEGLRLAGVTKSIVELRPANDRVDITVKGIHIDAAGVQPDQHEVGVRVSTPVRNAWLEKIILPAKRLLPEGVPVIEVPVERYGSHLVGNRTVDGCYLLGNLSRGMAYKGMPSPSCNPAPPPVLFLPGFGTAINLAYMLEPQPPGPQREGWSLLPVGTASYREVLQELRGWSVPVAPVYYDWRRPPAIIVREYLLPAINEYKRSQGVAQIGIIAHSFGGIVARSYIQSELYQFDVAFLVMAGTPSAGAVKAYGPWQAAQFPGDWQPVLHLVRYYRYRYQSFVTDDITAIRTFFPSVQSLLPTFAFLQRGTQRHTLEYQRNLTSQQLADTQALLYSRVPYVVTVAGTGFDTDQVLEVGGSSPRSPFWPDGQVSGAPIQSERGDGTVLMDSVRLRGAPQYAVQSSHGEVFAEVLSILKNLYPDNAPKKQPAKGAARSPTFLWFLFDCPIEVSITAPTGEVYRSTQPSGDLTFTTDDMIWMLVPEKMGEYEILIKALKSAEVRWWQGQGDIEVLAMEKNEEVRRSYLIQPSESLERQFTQPVKDQAESVEGFVTWPEWSPLTPFFQQSVAPTIFIDKSEFPDTQETNQLGAVRVRAGPSALLVLMAVRVRQLRRGPRRAPP